MHIYKRTAILVILTVVFWGCTPANANVTDLPSTEDVPLASTVQAVSPVQTIGALRSLLTYDDLMNRRPADSPVDESFASGLLEYPQYTRPAEFRGMKVPDVLLSGDHARIARWRREQSLLRTYHQRPDLLEGMELTEEDQNFLNSVIKSEI